MTPNRNRPLLALLTLLAAALPVRAVSAAAPGARVVTRGVPGAAGVPSWLPRYDLTIDLDVSGHRANVQMHATWTNRHQTPANELVFNAHSHYVVPDADVGLMAKTLEILRVYPGEALGFKDPPLEVHTVRLVCSPAPAGTPPQRTMADLAFRFEGDTRTTLVVPLPQPVGPGESVTVALNFTLNLPPKQGRWGQWRDVTFLSNWLPVFAVYDDVPGKPLRPLDKDHPVHTTYSPHWQPTPFVPWHQPFFNEAGVYRVRVTLPRDQKVACTGTIVNCQDMDGDRQQLDMHAEGVRDFALLCSARYREFVGEVAAQPGVPRIRVRILALPEHEYFARESVHYACQALATYSRWFGPYPYPDFTIAESYFGWNGNECATLVMIDERVFGMPHLAGSYVEYLVSHEICHQWWYNLVGTNGYCETFMDEAPAVYFSHRLLNEKVGRNNRMMRYPKALDWLPNIRRDDYRSYGMYGTFGRGENGPILQEMPEFGHVINLFSMAYDKGSRVIGMIEDRLQNEAAFLDFWHILYTRYQYRILRVEDFQRELEAYTGYSWEEFFHDWMRGGGLSDWSLEKVEVQPPPSAACPWYRRRKKWVERSVLGDAQGLTRVVVYLHQKAEYNEQTVLGFAMPGCEGYPIRIQIVPQRQSYHFDNPPADVQVLEGNRVRVEVLLPAEPTQIAVDPDQVLIDRDPSNNFWKTPVRWRLTPLYTFLEETDLTNAYDRWNVICGPWIYAAAYDDPWYTRSTMLGVRAGAYRTQEFNGGVYGAYRTDYRDLVVGADGLWEHWPYSHTEVGFNVEKRLTTVYRGDDNAFRGVAFGRYIFQYGDSLYLPPMHYVEMFGAYQDNFLPFVNNPIPGAIRFDHTATAGLHYRLDYLTPYWDPEGGFRVDVLYQGGVADLQKQVGLNEVIAQFSFVKSVPDFSEYLAANGTLYDLAGPVLRWLGDTRLALRAYGATGYPSNGEFFTLGGGELFRGFDLAERQGNTVWVGSVEWRVPLARGLTYDACDHIVGLRNVYGAVFYDVGNAYISDHSAGPTAHAIGGGLRLDVTWFGFVERTTLRFDMAKTVNAESPVQFWFGLNMPF
jgi:hypothetical protein